METMGTQIKAARLSRGWSQHRLAEASGVRLEHICRIERGQIDPRETTLRKLLGPLGLRLTVEGTA